MQVQTQTTPTLTRHDDGAVAILTLQAPQRLNALSDAMLAALTDAFARLADDRSIRAVILRGAGRAFCAGHDLHEMQSARDDPDGGVAAWADLFARCSEVMMAIPRLPQPVIAQVHGVAVAAGCQLVASCDMAVAADDARFGVNGVDIGLFCSTPMVALTRVMPRKAAFEMLTTGRLIGAAEAQGLGLINRVAAPGQLEAETLALAHRVAAKLGAAVRMGKAAFYEQATLPLAGAYALTGATMVRNMERSETDEGLDAFLCKRPPTWVQEP